MNARIGLAMVIAVSLGMGTPALAAPELLINGGCDRPVAQGWTVTLGTARTTGLIDAGDADRGGLGVLTPDQGAGFLVLEPGDPVSAVTQAGVYPFGSDRLVCRARVRLPERGSIRATLRAHDHAGATLIESAAYLNQPGLGWVDLALTLTVPSLANTWTLRFEATDPGPLGAHADAITMIGTCLADYNGDRVLNFFDLSSYISDFLASDPNADLTGNGLVDFFDLTELIDSFEFGCE